MNFDYCAAEYFVESISKYPRFTITLNDLKILRQRIGNETNSEVSDYLDKESEQDSLFLFKKFPDIFVLKKKSISLTDAFLSLHCPKMSLRKSKKFKNISNDVGDSLVMYFCKILTLHGPQHFLSLFNTLRNAHAEQFAQLFHHYTAADVYNFFLVHSNVFVLVNTVVYMSAEISSLSSEVKLSPVNLEVNNKAIQRTMTRLKNCVNILLKCFQPLHYIVLRQCISFIKEDAKYILDTISLVRQREFFESLSETNMDEFGFLYLKNHDADLGGSKRNKVILLTVYILAFKKEMLLQDLVAEINEKKLSSRNSPINITVEQLIQFVKKCYQIRISNTNYVSLSSKFKLPICSFQRPLKFGNGLEEIKSEVKSFYNNSNPYVETIVKNAPSGCKTLHENNNKLLQKPKHDVLSTDLLNITGLCQAVNERLRVSIFYLLWYFFPLDKTCLLKTLLHALDDVRISFCELSETDKHNFVTTCCCFIQSTSPEHLEDAEIDGNVLFQEIEMESNLLFTICMLTGSEKVHFLKIIAAMKKNNIVSHLTKSSVSNQFKYFRSISEYVYIADDGYVTLSQSFVKVKSTIESYLDKLANHKCLLKSNVLQIKNSSAITQSRTTEECKPVLNERGGKVAQTKISDVIPDIDKESITVLLPADTFPKLMFERLHYCGNLLRKYCECTASNDILKASIFALRKTYIYFANLLTSDKKMFIEKCYVFINEKRKDYCSAIISENEQVILFITYLLLKENVVHFERIIKELSRIDYNSSLCKQISRLNFKYFNEATEYFLINLNGFVTLKSSFFYMECDIDSAINSIEMSKLNIFLPNQINLSGKNPMLESLKDVNATSSPGQNTPSDSFKSMEWVEKTSRSLQLIWVDSDTKNSIIDFCFCVLSVTHLGRMYVGQLCKRLNSFTSGRLQNLFVYSTLSEKVKFFSTLSPYFYVTKDSLVTLKKIKNFMFKSNVRVSELCKSSKFASDYQFNESPRSSESLKSAEVKESPDPSSVASCNPKSKNSKKCRSKRKKQATGGNICNTEKEKQKSFKDKSSMNSNDFNKNVTDNIPKPKTDNNNDVLGASAANPLIAQNGESNSKVAINEANSVSKITSKTVLDLNFALKSVNSSNEVKNNNNIDNNKDMLRQDRENIQLQSITNEVKNKVHSANEDKTESNPEITSVLADKAKSFSFDETSQEFSNVETTVLKLRKKRRSKKKKQTTSDDICNNGKETNKSFKATSSMDSNAFDKNGTDNVTKPKTDKNNDVSGASVANPLIAQNGESNFDVAINNANGVSKAPSNTVMDLSFAMKSVDSDIEVKNNNNLGNNKDMLTQDRENIQLQSITNEVKNKVHSVNEEKTDSNSDITSVLADKVKSFRLDETTQEFSNVETKKENGLECVTSTSSTISLKNPNKHINNNKEMLTQNQESIQLHAITNEFGSRVHSTKYESKSNSEIISVLANKTKPFSFSETSQEFINVDTEKENGLETLSSTSNIIPLMEKSNTGLENDPQTQMVNQPFIDVNPCESTLIKKNLEKSESTVDVSSFLNDLSKLSRNNYKSVSTQTINFKPRTMSCLESLSKYGSFSSSRISSSFEKSEIFSQSSRKPSKLEDRDASHCGRFNDSYITEIDDSHLVSMNNNFSSRGSSNLKNVPEPRDVPRCSSIPFSAEERKIVSEFPNKLSKLNETDDSYEAYIESLIDKFLNSVDSSNFTSTSTAPEGFEGHMRKRVPSSEQNSFCDNSNCNKSLNAQSSSHCKGTTPLMTSMPSSFPDVSVPSLITEAPNIIESRAVTFFGIILGNYESGISIDFLKKTFKMASSEVQSFMCGHYKKDFLSFFQKHKEVFYVSTQSRNVYLLKKLPSFI